MMMPASIIHSHYGQNDNIKYDDYDNDQGFDQPIFASDISLSKLEKKNWKKLSTLSKIVNIIKNCQQQKLSNCQNCQRQKLSNCQKVSQVSCSKQWLVISSKQ